jgi:carboxyl-terminal processing protease
MRKGVLVSVFSVIFAVVIFGGGFLLGYGVGGGGTFLQSFFGNLAGQSEKSSPGTSQENSMDIFSEDIRSIEEALNFISANSISGKTKQELLRAAIEGMLSVLDDRYADYFPQREYSHIMESYSGTMSGIGVVVTQNKENQVIIISVIDGTPASEKGILAEDIIVEVDDTDIADKSIDEVVSMIKGEENTEVKITILRPSENKKYSHTITRRKFYVPNFYINTLEENILYIQYIDFQENGAEKLSEKLQEQADENIDGIIIDLRNNLGGTLDDAVNFCDLFLEEGTIVSVKGRTDYKDRTEEFEAKPGGFTDIPVVVLINGYSASAAELAAGALKDLGRAVIVGEKSFGKGTVQVLDELPDGSGIKFTTAKYYLPSGVTIDGTGITPDFVVGLTQDDTEDVQLNRAVEELKKLIENGQI